LSAGERGGIERRPPSPDSACPEDNTFEPGKIDLKRNPTRPAAAAAAARDPLTHLFFSFSGTFFFFFTFQLWPLQMEKINKSVSAIITNKTNLA
jgi:hypothetical protein